MAYLKPKWLFFCALGLFSAAGLAEEEGAAKADAKGVNKEQIEFNLKEARLNSLDNKIKDAEKRFAEALAAKKRSVDPLEQKRLAAILLDIAKERNRYVKDSIDVRQDILYRYPNKGKEIDKRFVPRQQRTAEQLENSTDLDRDLTETKRRIDKKFAPLMPKEELPAAPAKPAEAKGADPKKRLRLEK